MGGAIAIAALLGFYAAVIVLGSRIAPHVPEDEAAERRRAELPLFPFGRQLTEPPDAEEVRSGRYF